MKFAADSNTGGELNKINNTNDIKKNVKLKWQSASHAISRESRSTNTGASSSRDNQFLQTNDSDKNNNDNNSNNEKNKNDKDEGDLLVYGK